MDGDTVLVILVIIVAAIYGIYSFVAAISVAGHTKSFTKSGDIVNRQITDTNKTEDVLLSIATILAKITDSTAYEILSSKGQNLNRDQITNKLISELIDIYYDSNTSEDVLIDIAIFLGNITGHLGSDTAHIVSAWLIRCLQGVGYSLDINNQIRFALVTENNNINKISKHYALTREKNKYTNYLIGALDHKLYKIRSSAADALGSIVSEDQNIGNRDLIIDKLIAKLEDPVYDVRRYAVISLCRHIKDPRAIKPLQKAAEKAGDSGDWILQQIAEIENVVEIRKKSISKYFPHSNRVYVTRESLPETIHHEILEDIKVGNVPNIHQCLADSARALGADFVVEVTTWEKGNFWDGSHGTGKAVKIIEPASVDFSRIDGEWK